MIRRLLAVALLGLTTSPVIAGGSSAPFDYQPDPALKTASRGELEARIRRTCAATQAKLQNASATALERPCACYASRTLRALDRNEVQAFRDTGYFNDSARAKALAALDACRLPRPV